MPFDSENFQPADDVLRNLQAARDLISDPAKFWQAQDGVCPGRYCAALAVQEVASIGNAMPTLIVLRDLLHGESMSEIFHFNDTHTHADVLALFDRAIAARRAELLETNEVGAVASSASA